MAKGERSEHDDRRKVGRDDLDGRMADDLWRDYQGSLDHGLMEDEEGGWIDGMDNPEVARANRSYDSHVAGLSPEAYRAHVERRDNGGLGY
jgi:hypothetical protein